VCRKKGPSNTIVRDYVLPDYTHIKRGHVRTPGESRSGTEQVWSCIASINLSYFGRLFLHLFVVQSILFMLGESNESSP